VILQRFNNQVEKPFPSGFRSRVHLILANFGTDLLAAAMKTVLWSLP